MTNAFRIMVFPYGGGRRAISASKLAVGSNDPPTMPQLADNTASPGYDSLKNGPLAPRC
jgi:hypothetical protein